MNISPGYLSRILIVFCLMVSTVTSISQDGLKKIPRVLKKLEAGEPVTILALGDSITTHFGNYCRNKRYFRIPLQISYYGVFAGYLKMRYPEANIKLINKGIGGETANRGLARVDKDVIACKPDLVFVMYGANDGRGGRSEEQYGIELETIVKKIKKSGADVILVAPTMSLVDLAWLLPFRQRVLSLSKKLDTPVLDGTLALWPVDEDVKTLEEVQQYLSRHFPHYGDNIHPWYPGHVQMGRRLFEQLTEGIPEPPLTLKISTKGKLTFPGSITFTLSCKNVSAKPFKGSVEVFLPYKLKINGQETITEKLPNRATGNRLCLPPMKLSLAPGATCRTSWTIKLPNQTDYDPAGPLGKFISGKSGVGVAVFSRARNYVDFIRPQFLQARISFSAPHKINFGNILPLSVSIKNVSAKPIEGNLVFPNRPERPVALSPGQKQKLTYYFPTSGINNPIRLSGLIVFHGSKQDILGMKNISLQAVPGVRAPEREISLDGNIDDWRGIEWHRIPTNNNNKMSFAAATNKSRLLIAFKAIDKVLSFDHKKIWTGEGFELYLDPRPEKLLGTSGPNFQLGFFPPKNPVGKVKVIKGSGTSREQVKMVKAIWKKTMDGYIIEAAVPFDMFSPPLKDGQVIGFGVACNDSAAKDQLRKQYQWVGNNSNYCDPSRYGLLRLGKSATPWRINVE